MSNRNGKIKLLSVKVERKPDERYDENGYLGIIAKALLWNPATQVTQVIRSGGLWGIDSDSAPDHLAGLEKEQLDNLTVELRALGIGRRAIQRAINKPNP